MDKYTDLHTGFNDPVTNIGGKRLNHILKPVDNYKYFWKITNPKNQNLTFIHLKCGQSFKTAILGESTFSYFFWQTVHYDCHRVKV